MFISFDDPDTLIPEDHPLRLIKQQADAELRRMRPAFAKAYSAIGRPSIPPEQLIKTLLLQALFSIRSERQLCEQINYDLLFKYFLDMAPDQRAWHPTTFTKNRERLEENGLMRRFFEGTVARAISTDAASDAHFSVDGTLIQAWASMKSFRPTGAFQASAKARRRIEQIIGWLKDVAGLRRTRFVGRWKTQLYLYAAAAGYNLLRRTSMAASRTSG